VSITFKTGAYLNIEILKLHTILMDSSNIPVKIGETTKREIAIA
jgi:hypothetical protein